MFSPLGTVLPELVCAQPYDIPGLPVWCNESGAAIVL